VTVLVVRHGKAGDRERWTGPDRDRPLSKRGRAQAAALALRLPQVADGPITRILSSSFVRCRQTVEPLAAAVGLAVKDDEALAEGEPLAATLALLAMLARQGPGTAVLCSHGDVIGNLVMWLAERGLVAGDLRCTKGSTWIIECGPDGEPTGARYEEAP
jgi:broad specificity phosphatase PhoE